MKAGPGCPQAAKFVGNVTGPINLASTYTNQYAITANKLEGFTK